MVGALSLTVKAVAPLNCSSPLLSTPAEMPYLLSWLFKLVSTEVKLEPVVVAATFAFTCWELPFE